MVAAKARYAKKQKIYARKIVLTPLFLPYLSKSYQVFQGIYQQNDQLVRQTQKLERQNEHLARQAQKLEHELNRVVRILEDMVLQTNARNFEQQKDKETQDHGLMQAFKKTKMSGNRSRKGVKEKNVAAAASTGDKVGCVCVSKEHCVKKKLC